MIASIGNAKDESLLKMTIMNVNQQTMIKSRKQGKR